MSTAEDPTYHQAQSEALWRLAGIHPHEFRLLLIEELERLRSEPTPDEQP